MNSNPHHTAYCRCLQEIYVRKGWDAIDDPAVDEIYDQMDFHWDHLSEEERISVWEFSNQLSEEKEHELRIESVS